MSLRSSKKRNAREYAHCAAARRSGAWVVERFSRSEIYARDRGLCGLCHTPVAAHEATLDHILPLSCGGDHIRANVRIAHVNCNAHRGNWNFGDLRMRRYRNSVPCTRRRWRSRDREFWNQIAQDIEAHCTRHGYPVWTDLRQWRGKRVKRTTVARQQSRRISAATIAHNGYCFQNAINALRHLPGGKLVVGWAKLASGRRIEHGWVELADGRIVDPTPTYLRRRSVTYRAVKRWTRYQIAKHQIAKRTLLDLLADAYS